MRTAKEIRKEMRELKAEMKEAGVKVTSMMNRQVSMYAARCNERLYALKLELEKATS
jgi:hypothetical protein